MIYPIKYHLNTPLECLLTTVPYTALSIHTKILRTARPRYTTKMGKGMVDWNSPKKCKMFHITNKRKLIRQPYNIFRRSRYSKILGLNFQNSLNWNHHIDLITKKANNATSFLQRNIHQCPRKTKELCYMTLVRPLVEYYSIIWDQFTEELEMVQRRAARMVFSDNRRTSNLTPMLQHLQWPTLREHRAHAKVTIMYRIVNRLVDDPTSNLTTIISARGQYHLQEPSATSDPSSQTPSTSGTVFPRQL
jgi:hypothetical protein